MTHWILRLMLTLAVSLEAHGQGGSRADYERAYSLPQRTENKVFHASVKARWLPDGKRMWYRVQTGPQAHEFVLVEMETGKRLAAGTLDELGLPAPSPTLTSKAGVSGPRPSQSGGDPIHVSFVNSWNQEVELLWIDDKGKPRSHGRLKPGARMDQNTYQGHVWRIEAAGPDVLAVIEAQDEGQQIIIDGRAPGAVMHPHPFSLSPDARWSAFVKDYNVHLLTSSAGKTLQLTTDGSANDGYHDISWSPDSACLVSIRVRKGPEHKVTLVDSSPADQVQPRLKVLDYLKPGDELPAPRAVLVNIATQKATVIANTWFPNFFTESGHIDIRWAPDGSEFFFDYNQRGHQLYRIIGVSAHTGVSRVVVEETSKTFIDYTRKTWRHWLDKTGELLWMSERDGWCHLWLYDVKSGQMKNQVTHGQWVVRRVEYVDEGKRQVWFMASGLRAGEDTYHEHLCRVNLDGSGFLQLTDGDGTHKVEFSPDRRFFVDVWSRADLPAITELRRSENGGKVCDLERSNVSALLAAGWTMPECFVAKGRDGTTTIHGVIIKPSNFDPSKKYPVVEEVYAGPHGAFAPKEFGRLIRQHSIAELGFIVVQADGMGTNHRGKAFHDLCWKNLKDAGFPDRIAWIKEAARTRPWMDLGHVGIYGGSAGGQTALRALLDHHEFYGVAVADCGCHDNRMDKIWWNEQWLGWPVDESYVRNSNVVDAHKLEGHLMLAVGELDANVDPATTMQVAHALEIADKDFDLVVMAGSGHGSLENPYGSRRRMDFLVRHLWKREPRWQP